MIKVKAGGLRCTYCHGGAQGLLEGCHECGALLHADCRRGLGRCSTLGCHGASIQTNGAEVTGVQVTGAQVTGVQVRAGARSERDAREPELSLPIRAFRFAKRHSGRLVASVALAILVGFFLFAACVGQSSCGSSRTAVLQSKVTMIRAASANFKSDTGRWPTSLGELVAKYPYAFEGNSAARDFLFVTRNREVWIAHEVDVVERDALGVPVIRLLRVLYEREPQRSEGEAKSF